MADTAIPTTPIAPAVNAGAGNNTIDANFEAARAAGTAQIGTPTGSYFAAQPTSPVVTTSGPAETVVNNTGNTITNGSNNPPVLPTPGNPSGATGDNSTLAAARAAGFNPAYDPNDDASVTAAIKSANQYLIDRQNSLDARRQQEIDNLTKQEGIDKQNLDDTQKNESGASARNLTYLQGGGQSASAQAYLDQLEVSHSREMTTLVAKYTSAIQAASNAYDDKDFALAEEMSKNASDIKKAAMDRNQKFLDDTIKIQTATNDDLKTQYELQAAARQDADTNLKFARDNGLHPDAQFFSSGGQIYFAGGPQAGQAAGASAKELVAAGVSSDLSNVQMIQAKRSGTLGEMDDYNQGLKAEGKPALNIEQYRAMELEDKKAVARAGAAITVAQQKFALTQDQTATLKNITSDWVNKHLVSNDTINSAEYKKAKKAFVGEYGSDAAPAFDQAMSVWVDSSNKGGPDKSGKEQPNYKDDYGIN